MNLFFRYSVAPVRGSVVNSAAYVAGMRYRDERTGRLFDHSARRAADRDEVAFNKCVSPAEKPVAAEKLWNAVAQRNRHPRGICGRMIVAAFPSILTHTQMIDRATSYAESLVGRYGVAVQFAIHTPRIDRSEDEDGRDADIDAEGNGNWHVHFLLSYCTVDAEGQPGWKQAALDPVSARRTGLPNFCKVERPLWAAQMNEALRALGLDDHVDHRSLRDRGSPYEVTRPLGPERWAFEQRGISTDVGRHNAAVEKRNASRRRQLEEVVRLKDAERTLATACLQRRERRFRSAIAQFPWNHQSLTSEAAATVLYVKRDSGVVAARDGGRFVEFGRKALLVDLGSENQILELLWERFRSTTPGCWLIDGPPALLKQANSYFDVRSRQLRESKTFEMSTTKELTRRWSGDETGDGETAGRESARISAAIAGLGSHRRSPTQCTATLPQREPQPADRNANDFDSTP